MKPILAAMVTIPALGALVGTRLLGVVIWLFAPLLGIEAIWLLALLAERRPDLELFGVEWASVAAMRAAEKSGALVTRGNDPSLPARYPPGAPIRSSAWPRSPIRSSVDSRPIWSRTRACSLLPQYECDASAP